MKDVTFEYLVNGKRLPSGQLTSTSVSQVFGSNEFSVAGNYSKTEEINEVQVIIKTQDKIQSTISVKPCGPIPTETQRCIPKVPTDTKPSSTDMFMKRLWAFKRINYLLTNAKECIKLVTAFNIGNNDSCLQEALGLALEYNFVTDLTSLVIEQNDDYIKKGPVQINLNPKFEEEPEFGERFGFNNIQSGLLTGVLGNIFFCLFHWICEILMPCPFMDPKKFGQTKTGFSYSKFRLKTFCRGTQFNSIIGLAQIVSTGAKHICSVNLHQLLF